MRGEFGGKFGMVGQQIPSARQGRGGLEQHKLPGQERSQRLIAQGFVAHTL
jgi:hypothetical protein